MNVPYWNSMEGPMISVSSMSLLVPPLRLMSALMWEVVRQRNVRQYGRVVEFVYLVTEAIPDIWTERQTQLLILALRAKVILVKLHSEQAEDLSSVEAHLQRLRSSPSEQAPEANFAKLVQRLIEDPERRRHFYKNVYPVEFGPDFDWALEVLLFRFFTTLEGRTPVPDFRQAAVWIKDAPAGLAEHMCDEDDLKVLLKSKLCHQRSAEMSTKTSLNPSERHLLRTLSLPPSPKQTDTSDLDRFNTEQLICSADIQDTSITDTEVPAETRHDPEEEEAPTVSTAGPPNRGSSSSQGLVAPSALISAPRRQVTHKCRRCGRYFIYRHELLEHQKLHAGEHPYKYSQCGKVFRGAGGLATHRRTRCTRAAYPCVKCGTDFKSIRERLRHKCAKEKPQTFGCPECGKTFQRRGLMEKHQLTHTQARCPQCGEACAGMSELRAHKVRVHANTHICESCGKAFKGKHELKAHMRCHTGERPFQCTYCGKRFSTGGYLTVHMRIHTGEKPYLCADCGTAYRTAGQLQSHRRVHTGEKPHKCAVCPRAFTNTGSLNQHKRVHTGERPYQCTYCGKQFSMRGNLTIHVRIHTGEKPYSCADCGKAFGSAGDLQVHRRVHTGEKPHKCAVCARAFVTASQLKAHQRVHTRERPYVCLLCGKGFSTNTDLKQHTLNHYGVRPYACQLCSKAYLCLNHLKRHLTTHGVERTASAVLTELTAPPEFWAGQFSVPLSSLGLLVPPLRLMSAVMWEVVRQRNVKHYQKLEEFVSMVTDAVPELMSKREGRLLSLGLRARTTLMLLRSEHPEDLKAVEIHLDRIRSSCIEEINDNIIDAPEANFMRLVQGLIEDNDGREHFLKNIFPMEYGPDFDTALETLVCEFFIRLEELLPVPDFKQTASWIGAEPSVLEEYMQCVSNGDDLKFLLQSKQCHGKLAKSGIAQFHSDDLLVPSMSLPPSLEVAITSHASDDENNEVPQIVMFEEELTTNSHVASTSADFPDSPKEQDAVPSPRRKQQSGMHQCPECDKCFKHHSVLVEHQRVHSGLQPYNCSECGRAFRTATLLAGHRLRKCKNAAYLCIKCGNSFPTSLEKFRHQCPKRGQSYECAHCGKSFQKSSSLKEHLLTHVQSRLFKCSHCGDGFPGIGELKYHQQVDHDKPYQCKQCGKSFISSRCLIKHQQRHQEAGEIHGGKSISGSKHRKISTSHRSSSGSLSSRKNAVKSAYPHARVTHNCPQCGRSFKYRFEFLEHQRFHTAVKPYKCSQCGKAFRTEAHLSGHRKRKCKNASHICTKCGCQFRSLHERVRHQCMQVMTKYECSHCGKTFKMAHLLRNHQMSEHQLPYSPNHRFRCRYCDVTFPGISELKYHQRVDHDKPYQCQECGKSFLSEKCLSNHEQRHNDDRPENCPVCRRGFRNRYDLKQHMRTHTGERPYQCTHCSQCFSTAGGLKSHTRVHTGEKPHVCPDCGKAFSQMGAMRTHRLTHTGERPFKCAVCGKGFTMAHKVTVHMRVHTGERPYVCSQCGKAFSDGSVLKQHMLNHSGVRPYHCQICPKTYTCLNHLRRHLKSHSNPN
ncbi:zinc finger protein 850-like [Gadus macrocephalus]|uniref:zinc finger protein 850-like n=1 Tax=Gadus macrocephalus TaxID=80720 RepID=UPI0028CBADF0|nr:zinc finger protein 850-like [Gadus macrocephalus]